MTPMEAPHQQIEDELFDVIAGLGPDRSDIRRDATFADLEIDSLDLVEISQIVESRWHIRFEPQDFADVRTVGEAVDLVVSRVGGR